MKKTTKAQESQMIMLMASFSLHAIRTSFLLMRPMYLMARSGMKNVIAYTMTSHLFLSPLVGTSSTSAILASFPFSAIWLRVSRFRNMSPSRIARHTRLALRIQIPRAKVPSSLIIMVVLPRPRRIK